jgi:hypothetical protein
MFADASDFALFSQSQMVQGIFFLHLLAATFLCGVIWFVQVVHYPLFSRTGAVEFAEYHRRHTTFTGWVVGPAMLAELGTALALVYLCPSILTFWPFTGALVLLGVIWLSTAFLQVPQHHALRRDYSRSMVKSLVAGNWVRTAAWSLRCVLLASIWIRAIGS